MTLNTSFAQGKETMFRMIAMGTATFAATAIAGLLMALTMADAGDPLHAGEMKNVTVIYKTSTDPFPPMKAQNADICRPGICQDI